MSRYEELKRRNPHLALAPVTDQAFRQYGRVLEGMETEELTGLVLDELERPETGSSYLPAVPCLDEGEMAERIRESLLGQMDWQIGLCHGHCDRMNALEWHMSSEINVGVTDMVLFLGDIRDMGKDGRYDSGKVRAFYLEENQAVEVYGTTLHFCPCEVDEEGFSCIVMLPRGSNEALEEGTEKKGFLWARNKWLVCHEEYDRLKEKGVRAGIYGENWNLTPIS